MAYLGSRPARTAVTSAQITDASVTAAKLATNAVTTVKIAADNVTTAKIAAANVTTAKLAASSALVGKNLFDNGSFLVAQRGTSFTGVTPSTTPNYTLDRWFALAGYGTPADRYTISQVAAAAGALLDGFPVAIRALTTTADTSPHADRYSSAITQKVELSVARQLGYGAAGAKSLTVSFWARSSETGLHGLALGMNNSGVINPQTYSVTSADTWEKMSVTFSPNTSTAIATTEYGLALFFLTQIGTASDDGTRDTWSNKFGYTAIADIAGATSRYIEITGVQAEVGSVATDFAHEPYSTTLAKCQRYLYRINQPASGYESVGSGYAKTSTVALIAVKHPVTMRAQPTGSSGGTIADIDNRRAGAAEDTTAISIYSNGTDVNIIQFTIGAGNFTVGEGIITYMNAGSNSTFIQLTAEL